MTSRLVLVLGDLYIPDRAPVRTPRSSPPNEEIPRANDETHRTSRKRYPPSSPSSPPPPHQPPPQPALTPPLPVQKTAGPGQNRANPLPRKPNLQTPLRIPARHRSRPANRQRRLRRRSAESPPLQSRHARQLAHRLHARAHHHPPR